MMKNIFTTILFLTGFLMSSSLLAADVDALSFNITVVSLDADCLGGGGSATLEMSGGVAPYTATFFGQNYSSTQDQIQINNLLIGAYEVQVADATGCISTINFIIDFGFLTASIDCTDTPNTVSANAEGGSPPYSYQWSDGSTTQEITVVDNTNYSVTITDSGACQGFDSYTHAEFNGNIFCNDGVNLSISPNTIIVPDMLIEGPYAICDTDIEFNLLDDQGVEIAGYAASHPVDCSHIGLLSYNLRDNISGIECSGMIIVEDKSGPVPYCIQLSTVVLGDNQDVEIYAIDFDAGSFDFCDPTDLRYTFTSTPPEFDPNFNAAQNSSYMTVGCDAVFSLQEISIYVWDGQGNSDWCTISVNFDDSANPCTLVGDYVEVVDGLCNFAGYDRYNILLNGTEVENIGCFYPLETGNLVAGTNVVSITNTDNSTYLNGISTLDLIIFIRGLLNGFDSNIEAVLADFDGDLALSTQDLTQLRMSIIGLLTEVDAPYYKIFPADFTFPADFNIFDQQNDFTTYEFEDSDVGNDHLISIFKSGDLNNTAFFNEEIISDNREAATLSFDNVEMQVGQTYFLDFEVTSEEDFKAATFGLSASGVEIKSIDYHGADIIENLTADLLKLSFVDFASANSFRFTLELEATQAISAEDAFTISEDFANEIGFADLSLSTIGLTANDVTSSENLIIEGVNIFPNPASDYINLLFGQNFVGAEKKVEILALDGRLLNSIFTNEDQLQIDTRSFQSQGLNIVKVQIDNKIMLSKLVIE